MSTVDAPPVLHPLEPLSAEEVARATATLTAERGLAPTSRFVFIILHEPRQGRRLGGRARRA